jgi:hypothetical protein
VPEGLWEDAFDEQGRPAWTVIISVQEFVLLASTEQIEPGGITRVIARSTRLEHIGRLCTLTVSNPGAAAPAVYTGTMEPNAIGGSEALFLVAGLTPGVSTLYADVSDA